MINSKGKISQIAKLLGLYSGYEYDENSNVNTDYYNTVAKWQTLISLHNGMFPNSNTYQELSALIGSEVFNEI